MLATITLILSIVALPSSLQSRALAAESIDGSVSPPSSTASTASCQDPEPSQAEGPQSTPSESPTTVVSPPGGVWNFSATSSRLYVVNGNGVGVYSIGGSLLDQFTLPPSLTTNIFTGAAISDNGISQPVVDASGTIYISSYYADIVAAFAPTGAELWAVRPPNLPTNIFPITTTESSFNLAVSTVDDIQQSYLYTPAGEAGGTVRLWLPGSAYTTSSATGNLIVSDGTGHVQTWTGNGETMLSEFGSSDLTFAGKSTGGPASFFYEGQSAQGPDGNIYSADGLSHITVTSQAGILLGSTDLGAALTHSGVDGGLAVEGDNLYFSVGPPFNSGQATISVLPISVVEQYLTDPQSPSNTLGWGAGVSTPEQGNYFPAGSPVTITANLDPWWTEVAPDYELRYSIWNAEAIATGSPPAAITVALPATASALEDIPLTVPGADQVAGPYEVEVALYATGTDPPTEVGATCMPYTVGAPADRLNLGALPSGMGAGGPTDPRGVALNAQLGLNGFRGQSIDWSTFLPNCSATSPTTASCGPTAMDLTNAPTSYYQAAYLAAQDGVTYWVQVTGGDPISSALVNGGWWQADIQALAEHYSTVPVGCAACAQVTAWEPWNEPNNTGWSNPADYVSRVLEPFYLGVKAANPSATVIGGSTLGTALSWWQGLVAAGGLQWLNVAAVHPYPGNNDSWEEDGIPAQLQAIEAVIGTKPLWISEVGWWGDGDYNFLVQADQVARAMIWQKALHIPVWNYFFDEGSWGNDGVSFSLIQTSSSDDDYVKPAALATMTAAAQLAGKTYMSMPSTSIPATKEALFGSNPAVGSDTAAVWSDGLSVASALTVMSPATGAVPVTFTDEYGNTTSVTLQPGTVYYFPISGAVTYISYPPGDSVSLAPAERYGTNLALASAGATATASTGNPAAALTDPTMDTSYGQGWTSTPGDTSPSVTVHLTSPSSIDRVLVDTQSVGSVAPGLRDYTVSAESPTGAWRQVGTVTGQFQNHIEEVDFSPVEATAVKITVETVNFGGYYGGAIPPWWPSTSPAVAFLHAVEVFAGTGGPALAEGLSLQSLGIPALDPSTTPAGPSVPTTTTTTPPTTVPRPSPGTGATSTPVGYWLTTSNGDVFPFGDTFSYGSLAGIHLSDPIVGMAATPDGKGYWLVASDGGVFSFGDATFYGSTGAIHLNEPIVGMAATPDGKGYWLVASDGGVFSFGDATFYGSTGAIHLNEPIVGMAATPDGKGYWLVASDGGIFSFGDATFYGSTGAIHLNEPIVGMAATPDGKGYWLVASDGGIFSFGDATFYGSTAGMPLPAPIDALVLAPDAGYWIVSSAGDVYSFGSPYLGSPMGAVQGKVAGAAAA